MTTNTFTKENKMIYHLMLKEKELSTENSPLAALQGRLTPESGITSKKQTKPLSSLKMKMKMPSFS